MYCIAYPLPPFAAKLCAVQAEVMRKAMRKVMRKVFIFDFISYVQSYAHPFCFASCAVQAAKMHKIEMTKPSQIIEMTAIEMTSG